MNIDYEWNLHHENDKIKQLEHRLAETENRLKDAETVLSMAEDNTKMPHQHSDPQLRLYCLAERASEYFKKHGVSNG
jgi:hypothetical protein